MRESSGGCKTSEAAVEAIAAAAATGLPGLAAPSKIPIGDAWAVFQHHLAEAQLGPAAAADATPAPAEVPPGPK
jgi:hypothetical protein